MPEPLRPRQTHLTRGRCESAMSETIPALRHAPILRHAMRVRYSEVDYQGIVYVAHYVTYFDHGIHEFFRALPYDYTAIRKTSGTDFHTVRTLVEYSGRCASTSASRSRCASAGSAAPA